MYYANSAGQNLSSHCALVGLLAEQIVRLLYPGQSNWAQAAFYAGALHDPAGKMEPTFALHLRQGAVTEEGEGGTHIEQPQEPGEFSFNEFPRHNEVSWACLRALIHEDESVDQFFSGNREVWDCVLYAVYWHHAQPLRSEEARSRFSTLEGILSPVESWIGAAAGPLEQMFGEIGNKAGRPMGLRLRARLGSIEGISVPRFKRHYTDEAAVTGGRERRGRQALSLEAMRSAVRSAVVTADRLVSRVSAAELDAALPRAREGDFGHLLAPFAADRLRLIREQIGGMLDRFDRMAGDAAGQARNEQQARAAAALCRRPISVLQGPAGCGKTKVLLQCLQEAGARRAFILVPRAAIGEGLFEELTTEYGLTDGVEIYTGNVRRLSQADGTSIETPEHLQFQGNLVITTIDQVCSIALSHDRIDLLSELASSTLAFDEFHELFDLPGIVLLFLELMKMRRELPTSRKAHTILVSATPNPYLLAELGLEESSIVRMPSFNQRPVQLTLESFDKDAHPFYAVGEPGDILISNSASVAQRCALAALRQQRPALCYHSNFSAADKQQVLTQVLETFGKDRRRAPALLYSGPIVQASLNVSAPTLHSEICTADDWLQRLGRANRFAQQEQTCMRTYALRARDGAPSAAFPALRQRLQDERAQAWLAFFQRRRLWERCWSLDELYTLYGEFHASDDARRAYEADFAKVLRESAKTFKSSVFDPVQYPRAPDRKSKRLSSKSLRGVSHYVLPVRADFDGSGTMRSWRWLFCDESPDKETLTLDVGELATTEPVEQVELRESARRAVKDLGARELTLGLPKALGKQLGNKRSLKSFATWQALARGRELPVLISAPWRTGAPLSFERIYVTYDSVLLGAMRRTHLEAIVGRTNFS